jgi:Flp pilus assembly protein TadG
MRPSDVIRRLRTFLRAADDRGQAIVLVALMLTTLFGFIGLVVDVGWFQVNLVRVQRAADAGALAGSVYLPGDVPGAQSAAAGAATQNGYTDNGTTVRVIATQDTVNSQLLNVTISAPVRTWFMRMFGVNQITASRNARAEFILPVAMGSPVNYYGVSQLCKDSSRPTPPATCGQVQDASGAGSLVSQGFWGAVMAKGANHKSGDAYSAFYDPNPTVSTEYDPNGYAYVIDFPAGTTGGKVWVFDPVFCALGHDTSGSGAYLGTGDHWLGHSGGTPPSVTTQFQLWDTRGTPYSTADDILLATDGGLFTNMNYVDRSLNFRGNQNYEDSPGYDGSGAATSDCSTLTPGTAAEWHNKWWQVPAPALGPGQYRLQVFTSSAGNNSTNAENVFGLEATSTAGPGGHVYGQSRMCAYVNLPSAGDSYFYLAQIPVVHAGKTLEIRLFDPGDTRNTYLYILAPTPTGWAETPFSWSATGGGGSGTSSGTPPGLQSSDWSTNFFDNRWVTITIPLPTTYAANQQGWWKIRYNVGAAGNDTTTWSVNIRGNPVHLVTP